MKNVVIILILLLPNTCEASYGWSFTHYSILVGQQYQLGNKMYRSFDLQYDHFRRSCLIRPRYYGVGLNYSINQNISEFGLKGIWNPTRRAFSASYSLRFYPYIFGQGSLIRTQSPDPITSEIKHVNSYSFRPGLGLTGNFKEMRVLIMTG